MRIIIIISVILLAALAAVYITPETFGLTILERNSPAVSITRNAAGEYIVNASDAQSDLGNIVVVAEQGGTATTLEELNAPMVRSKELKLSFLKLKEGTANITARVEDDSFWRNSSQATEEVLVDFSPPKVTLLSLQHVASQGGAEFVIYKAVDSNISNHGVAVGEDFFPGFKIEDATPGKSLADTYVSLFALPLGYQSQGAPAEIQVRDAAGNITKLPLHFRLEERRQNKVEMNLNDNFLSRKTAELFPGFQRMATLTNHEIREEPGIPELVWKFKLINKDYRGLLDAELKELFTSSTLPRQWKEGFIKPMSSATSSTFGEIRSYKYKELEAGGSIHNGLDLASVNNDQVRAANDGKVVLAKEFGIYGNCVVIDHGLGLFTLYGHLSTTAVNLGDSVTRGHVLGQSGQTGLAGGDHLHFEFRLRNTPITPIEWWDAKWIRDNIDGKIAELAE